MIFAASSHIGGGLIRTLIGSVAARPLLFAGMMLYWVWVNMGYQTSAVLQPVSLGDVVVASQMGPLFMSAVAYAAISIWFARTRIVFRGDGFIVVIGVLMACSSLVLTAWIDFAMAPAIDGAALAFEHAASTELSMLVYAIGSILFGISSACMCIELQRVFGSLGSGHVLFHGSLSMVGSLIVVAGLSATPMLVRQAAFAVTPVLASLCLVRVRREFTKRDLFERGLKERLNIPHKLLFTALLHGLTYGLLLGNPVAQEMGGSLLGVSIAAYAAAAVVTMATTAVLRLDFNALLYQVGFPLAAFGMYLLLIIDNALVGMFVQLAGFCFLHLVMWGVCAFLIKHFDFPATWVVGTSTCFFMAGQCIGAFAGIAIGIQQESERWLFAVILTAIMFVLGSSLCMVSSKNLRTGWGLAKVDLQEDSGSAKERFVIDAFASENDLTERERDVLIGLARGKNRRSMSEEMHISVETVKSHIQHVYRKCGVHSQQELIRLLELRSRRMDD